MAFRKKQLSASGRTVSIAATVTPGTLIHTAVTDANPDLYDEVWVWLSHEDGSGSEVVVTIEIGNAANMVTAGIVPGNEPVLLMPGIPMKDGDTVRAFASSANKVHAYGYVNRIDP